MSKRSTRLARLLALTALPTTLLVAVIVKGDLGRGQEGRPVPAVAPRDHLPLITTSLKHSLGVLRVGQGGGCMVMLLNPGLRRIAIDKVETDCPCLLATPASLVVDPGASTPLTVTFDPSHDPDFKGKLGVGVYGYAAGAEVFRTTVELEVASDPVNHPSHGPATGEDD
ncbi:Protein of unknown function [Singulisphaera sp. GP187]|uniref:Ig-like domain-containing protein n=1 Tax=Singulisphaera sp. GP187 TaxID=1882752 RepID=UPI00092AB8DC|nr:DUF1573 domain-containing protein [Singulisphaera sp. GP187]SIO46788.1 Protein of unknown function [Singulisphaera sp. GP187]